MQAPIRSCLKRSSTRPAQHAVHFPPSQALCNTFHTHSPSAYDRSPIVVSQNTCALPERNGRTYVLDESASYRAASSHSSASSPRSYHSRSVTDDRRAGIAPLPQLIPDVSSSESDESDGFSTSPSIPFANPAGHYYSYGAHGLPTKYEWDSPVYNPSDNSGDINALSFLPYPPSPNVHDDKSKRRRSRQQQDSYLDLDRMRSANNSNDSSSSLEEDRFVPPPPKKRSSSRRREYLNQMSSTGGLCASFSNMGLDDGCLGGF